MIFIYCLLAVICIYIVFIAAPAFVCYKTIFCRKNGIPYTERDLSGTYLEPFTKRIQDDFRFFEEAEYSRVSIKAFDGTELAGRYYSAGQGKVAVCMHGYSATALNCFASTGRFLLENGYDVLLTDQRAHGESGGRYTTMGILEQEDVLSWCEWACGQNGISEVILAGVSMGCASVAYASDRVTDSKVKAMILDCGFTSPYSQLSHDCRKRHLPVGLLMPAIAFFTRLLLGIDIRQSVWKSLEKTEIPALFIHGRMDDTVPLSETETNFSHCRSDKRLYIRDDAYHTNAFIAGGREAEETVRTFLHIN